MTKTMYRFFKLVMIGFLFLSIESCKSNETAEHHNEKEQEVEEEKIILSQEQIKSSRLELVTAKEHPFVITLDALGTIASDTDRLVQVRPAQKGVLKEKLVAIGDTINRGQTLLRFQLDETENMEEIVAPQSGIVVGFYAQTGGRVDPGIPIVTIADTSKLRLGLDVYEKDIGRVQKGQRVEIRTSASPDQYFWGRITYISPRVDEESRTVKVRVDVVNPKGKLKFGMFVTGRIHISKRLALAIPASSLQKFKGKETVFVKEGENEFEPRTIDIGERSKDLIEIKEGIREGEVVVGDGSFILKSELSKEEIGGDDD